MEFLKTLKTPTPVFPNEANYIVTVSGEDTLANAFQKLISYNLHSVPVRDSTTPNHILGFFSIIDLVCYLLESLCEGSEFPEGDLGGVVSVLTEKEHFKHLKVREVMGVSGQQLLTVGEHDTLDKVAKQIAERRIHRAVALSSTGDLVNVITQSRIIQCINELWDVDKSLKSLAGVTVADAHIGTKDVFKIGDDRPAIEAFKLMRERGVTGIAVVKAGTNELVGNISAHDLGLVRSTGSYLKMLYAPLSDWLQAIKSFLPAHGPILTSPTPTAIKCTAAEYLKDVVNRMVKEEVHRVYIVDGAQSSNLVGVIALWDVLNLVVSKSS